MLGQLLDGRYRVIQELAAGGFAQTYLAEDTRLPGNPKCVVKHLKPVIEDPVFRAKAMDLFRVEAETLQRLGRHEQIPQLYAYFEEDGEFFLVQEFIAGHLLSTELPPGSRMSEARVLRMIEELLLILQFVHSYNVIHRDVKPSNIIRRHIDGKLVLIDFGTVKQVQADVLGTRATNQLNQAKATLPIGTPGYMSKEQERGKAVASSDIYALGMVALQALTGMHPSELKRDDQREIIWRDHAKVSREFGAILDCMVRYDPKNRYRRTLEVLTDVEKLIAKRSPADHDTAKEIHNHPNISTGWLIGGVVVAIAGSLTLINGLVGISSNGANPSQVNSNPLPSPTNPVVTSSSPTVTPVSTATPIATPTVPSPTPVATPTPSNATPSPEASTPPPTGNYERLRQYLQQKKWAQADQETYNLLLQKAGKRSYNDGVLYADELSTISCADVALIDQLWSQASEGQLGLTAQKRLYVGEGNDWRKFYEKTGWWNESGDWQIDLLYDRTKRRWFYGTERQPNYTKPPAGHLPLVVREPAPQSQSKQAVFYRCLS
ncbi:MAG: GUN4 domain-containing protein [Pseudanabaena sp. ELA607]|jgi:serine/threonine-protein kinase